MFPKPCIGLLSFRDSRWGFSVKNADVWETSFLGISGLWLVVIMLGGPNKWEMVGMSFFRRQERRQERVF